MAQISTQHSTTIRIPYNPAIIEDVLQYTLEACDIPADVNDTGSAISIEVATSDLVRTVRFLEAIGML